MSDQADIAVDADCLRFLGHVLEAYFAWRLGSNKLGFVSSSKAMQPPSITENRRVINMSDDQFVRVDQCLARSSGRTLLEIEYCDSGENRQKARRAGYGGGNHSIVVAHYMADVQDAEQELYWLLMPDIEEWHHECVWQPAIDRRRARQR